MQRLSVGFAAAVFLGSVSLLGAQNAGGLIAVHLRSDAKKILRGPLAGESLAGVRIKGEASTIPAADIADVDYSEQIGNLAVTAKYREAVLAERDARQAKTPGDRVAKLKEAAAGFREALGKIDASVPAARRHAAFKAAYLDALLALGSGAAADRAAAIKQLTKFKSENKDAWQLIHVWQALARLHAAEGNLAAARQALDELAAAPVTEQLKHESRFLLGELHMDARQYAEAQKIFQDLMAALPKGSPLAARARLAEAQAVAVASDNLDQAVAKLKAILNESTDKGLRAAAYNALGEAYYRRDRLQEARWNFLWVDVVYNQDREEHARALYYLWRIFTRLNEPERGQEFFNTLISGSAYAGTEFHRRAQEEAKKLQ